MSTLTVGTISEKVTDAGVAVDGVTLKDGGATFTSAVTATDNTVDLGASSTRFKDLYLSGGAYLGGTGSANYLDDYEEGTWTPVWSASGSATYGIQVGTYTKVGNIVHASCYLFMTNKSTLSGALQLSGFPFTSENLSNNYQSGSIWINNTVNGNVFDGDFNLQGYIAPNSALFNVQSLDGDGTVAALGTSDVNNTTDLMINISYRTA
jgi:hypothetical protein